MSYGLGHSKKVVYMKIFRLASLAMQVVTLAKSIDRSVTAMRRSTKMVGHLTPATMPTKIGYCASLMAAAAIVSTSALANVTVNQVDIPNGGNIGRGQDVTIGLQYTRLNSNATDIFVAIPAELSVNPPAVPAPCVLIAGPIVQCTVPAGASGDTGTINFQVRGAVTGGNNLTATPSLGTGASQSFTVRNSGDVTVLKVKQTPTGNPVQGQSVTFRLTPQILAVNGVQDDIPAGATVTITDTLPGTATDFTVTAINVSNAANVSCSSNLTSVNSSRSVVCTITGPVSRSALGTIDIVGTAGNNGTFTNTANIAADNTQYIDLNVNNNIANLNYIVDPGSDARPTGSSFPSGPVLTSTSQNLVLAFNNNGTTTIPTGGTVRAAIPTGFTIGTLPSGCVNSGAGTVNGISGTVVTCTAGAVTGGNTQNFSIPLTTPSAATSGNIGVEVATPAGFADANTANNTLLLPYQIVNPYADLSLTKAKGPTPAAAGTNITNTIAITNNNVVAANYTAGNTANALRFVDTMSIDEEFVSVSAGWTCTDAPNVPAAGQRRVTCTKDAGGTLAVGATETVTLTTRPRATISGSVTLDNTACTGATAATQSGLAGPTPADNNTGNDCQTQRVLGTSVITGQAQTSILKETSNDGMTYGATTAVSGNQNSVYWRMTITTPTTAVNSAQQTIPTLDLTDNVPGLLNISSPGSPAPGYVTPPVSVTVSGSATSGCPATVPAGGSLFCSFPNVAPGSTIVITFQVDRPIASGTLTNTGVLTSGSAFLTASAGGQLSSTATATVAPRVDVAVTTKSINPPNSTTEPRVGQNVQFNITAQNFGPDTLNGGMTITDTIDTTKYRVISASGAGMTCGISGGLVSCVSGGTINRYDVRTITIVVQPIKPASLPPGANDIAYASEVNTAQVALNTATNCEFRVESTTMPGAPSTTCNDANATSNNARSVTYDVKVPRIDLIQAKTRVLPMGQSSFGIGDPLRYRFSIRNAGPSRAERVVMTDVLTVPAGFSLSTPVVENINGAAPAGGFSLDTTKNSSVTCSQASTNANIICVLAGTAPTTTNANNFLDPGREVNFEIVLTMTGNATTPVTFGNSANVCADETTNFESSGACSQVPTVAGNNLASVNDVVFPKTDLAAAKTATPTTASINEPVRYDIAIRNLGPNQTTQVRISDVLPPDMEFFATGANAPVVVNGSGVTATITPTCTATPTAITAAGQTQTINCVLDAGSGVIPVASSASDASNVFTLRIFARAKAPFYAGPYATNRTNTVTVSPGQDSAGTPLSIDTVSGNNSATANVQITNISLAGRVFRDNDNTGTFTSGDVGIGNVTVTLTSSLPGAVDAFGQPFAARTVTTTTGGTVGSYLFDNLPPGTYVVTETQSTTGGLQNGSTSPPAPTGAATAGTYNRGGVSGDSTFTGVVLAAGNTAINYNFPEVQGATLSGYVYHDVNNDGTRATTGEPGISGIEVCLTGNQSDGTPLPTPTCQTTDTNGFYSFAGLPASDMTGYTVTERAQPAGFFDGKEKPGAGAVVPNSENPARAAGTGAGGITTGTTNLAFDVIPNVVVSAGATVTENNFGEIRPSSISGTVYFDPNNNQLLDGTETGRQAGVTITLSGTDINGNTVTATAVTDMMGNYSFTGLLPGQYTVTQSNVTNFSNSGAGTQGAVGTNGASPFLDRAGTSLTTSLGTVGGTFVTPAINTITLAPNGSSTGNNFGLLTSSIAGRVCIDDGASGGTPNNGRCETGEAGINMVSLTLTGTAADGTTMVSRTATTDMTGAYIFDNLPLPNSMGYTIVETQPSAFLDGSQNPGALAPRNGTNTPINLGTATTAANTDSVSGIFFTRATTGTGYDFGELQGAQVIGFVYQDLNNNGIRDVGEPGIPGVQMELTGNNNFGTSVGTLTATTDMNGRYVIAVPPSDSTGYTVREVAQPAGLYDGRDARGAQGAMQGTGTVLPNSSNGASPAPGTTNAATDQITGIVVPSGASVQENNFGELPTASISGTVYFDPNNNATLEASETARQAGVTITLSGTDINGNAVSRMLTTDSMGNYAFTGLLPGQYVVTQSPFANFSNTGASAQGPVGTLGTNPFQNRAGTSLAPANGAVTGGFATPAVGSAMTPITIGPGGSSTGNNFGLIASTIAGRVCTDEGAGAGGVANDGRCQAGEPGIAGVTITLTGTAADGTTMVSRTATTDGMGNYTIADLPIPNAAGYTIVETQPTMPIAFFDGSQQAGTLNGINPTGAISTVGTPTTAANTDTISGIIFTRSVNGAGYDFGELRPATVRGFVYEDTNNNGVFDAGEPPLNGVQMRLTGTDAFGTPQTLLVSTDMTGAYVFTVPPSDSTGYTVEQVTQPAGLFDGRDARGQVGSGTPTVLPNSSNGAGSQGYVAGGVAPGTTNAATDRVTGIVLGSNQTHQDNNFGEIRPAQISGAVYLDRNGNVTRDPSETVGVPGTTITITGTDVNGNMVSRTATTDMMGAYSFTSLLPGTYTVTEGAVPAYSHTGASAQGPNTLGANFQNRAGTTTTTVAAGTPAGGTTTPALNTIAIGAGGNSQGNNFGERPSTLAGRVCIDNGTGGGTTNDGRCQTGEPGIAGVTVTLTGTAADGTAVNLTAVTDMTGAYSFADLKLPNSTGYTLTESPPPGLVDGRQTAGTLSPAGTPGTTTNAVGNDAITGIVFTQATAATAYDFGELRPASMSGVVYADSNGNNVRDPGVDPGLPGVTVTLTGTDIDGNMVNIVAMTDMTGRYTFPNLRPGSYLVTETQPPFATDRAETVGTGLATPGTTPMNDQFSITIRENENAVDFNFGEVAASIAGFVYEDLNANGVRDPGEPGIPGVAMTLTGTDNMNMAVTRNVVTAMDGSYVFTALPTSNTAGYTVRETQPMAFADARESVGTVGGTPRGNAMVNDQISGIQIGPADTGINYNFGEVRVGSITGTTYVDANNNGVRDGTDPPLPGVVVTLTGTNFLGQPVMLTTTTDATGNYTFPNLLPGTYTVTETQPAGYADGTANPGSTGGTAAPNVISNIPIASGQNSTGNNFGERLFGVSGAVYEDRNNDGIQGPDEPGIPGVVITLTGRDNAGNPVNLTVTTDAQGRYTFPNVPPSDATGYTLTQTQPSAFLEGRATPGNGGGTANPNGNVISGLVLGGTSPSALTNYNFGEVRPGSIAGTVFDDRNNNGVRDAGEPPIPGTTITLTGTDDRGQMVSRTVTTDANGNYLFDNLRPGTYTVRETQPANFQDGSDIVGSLGGMNSANDVLSNIVLRSGDQGTGYNFAEISGGISGQVYVDLNNNGVRDPGEPGIAGVTITLTGTDSSGNPVTRTVTTDADGQYAILGLPPSGPQGYTITQTQPNLYADGTTRAGSLGGAIVPNRVSNIVFPGGSIVPGYDFGERGIAIGGTVYVDVNDNGVIDSGELPIPNTTITLTGRDANGNPVTRTLTTGADGRYNFQGLPLPDANGYTITQTQPAGYLDARETVGSLGGTAPANDVFNVRVTTPGATGTGYNFGERLQNPGSISGRVFLDVNGDGVDNDGGNSGQSGWIVELTVPGPDGRPIVVATVRTGPNGEYSFGNLPPGNYSVVFRNPSNNIVTGRIDNIGVAAGQNVTRQDLPIQPTGVIYDNCTGRPVAGARVFIAGPAGFDPNIHLVDPAMQGQTVGADGIYTMRLTPNAPAGVYTLSVLPPAGYTTQGQSQPQPIALNTTTCPVDPNPTTPCLVTPTARPVISGQCTVSTGSDAINPPPGPIYYNQLLIVGGSGGSSPQDIGNNHIGLTPQSRGTQISLTKSVARLNVVRGELVPYTITARNVSMTTLTNVYIVDVPPPGFRFVPGSARITTGTASTSTPIVPEVDGSNLGFLIPRFAPNDFVSITLLLSPGVGVGEGEYRNLAIARANNPRGGALSNLGEAIVRIVADPLFDCTDIIGKVYDDRNTNGYHDDGEPGLKGVRVISARGVTATTDAEGRYHIACAAVPQQDLGSNFVLKLDERSLPSGYRVTTDNPLVERLTRGKIVKMNFGATIHRVVRLDISDAAFESGKSNLKPEFVTRVNELMTLLGERPSILRVGYVVTANESQSLIDERIKAIKGNVAERWERERKKPRNKDDKANIAQYALDIEVEVVRDQPSSSGSDVAQGGRK